MPNKAREVFYVMEGYCGASCVGTLCVGQCLTPGDVDCVQTRN